MFVFICFDCIIVICVESLHDRTLTPIAPGWVVLYS